MKIDDIKNFIQSANINFLFGAGLSSPYLSTLSKIEDHLTELSNKKELDKNIAKIVKASIYKEFFCNVILKNRIKGEGFEGVLNRYSRFLCLWNNIMHNRCGNLRSKQLNIFSTNIDTFVERAAEVSNVEFNDGFIGSIEPVFNEANFQKSVIKSSLHFQNSTELPVFNLLKMHGSINWRIQDDIIHNDFSLNQIEQINEAVSELEKVELLVSYDKQDLNNMISAAEKINITKDNEAVLENFISVYEQLIIVNPTKKKFSETVTDVHFYELMRLYSNSLEKENSLLFVMGFSFADEHILNLTKRVLQINPTLLVIIFAYNDSAVKLYEQRFGSTPNVKLINAAEFSQINELKENQELSVFDFDSINSVYENILKKIPVSFEYGK